MNDNNSHDKTPDQSRIARAVDAQTRQREGAPQDHPAFDAMVRTTWRLLQDDGCPWDRVQTHQTLAPFMLEEAYEAAEAMENNNAQALKEELGDVLMQVVLNTEIARRDGEFTLDDVCAELNKKMIRRHSHVFGGDTAQNEEEVLSIWEKNKAQERADKTEEGPERLLGSVPINFPALTQAQKVTKRAARVGFDWDSVDDIWEKFDEERQEFLDEEPFSDAQEEEFGDMLFTLVNIARHYKIDPERALCTSTRKFRARFESMEDQAYAQGVRLEDLDLAGLDKLWENAKNED